MAVRAVRAVRFRAALFAVLALVGGLALVGWPGTLAASRAQDGTKARAKAKASSVPPAVDRSAPTAPTAPTTLSGVFSNAQADRGRDMYLALCQSCHVAVAHTGPVFRGHWAGRPLSDLYTFVVTRMPKNEPASLAPETYADLVAYILKLNQLPSGGAELAPDLAAMKHVRIQFAPSPKRAKR